MIDRPTKDGKVKIGRWKWLPLLALSLFMVFAQPRPAYAQITCTNCSTIFEELIQDGKQIAQWAAEAAQWAIQNLLTSAQSIGDLIGKMAQLEGQKSIANVEMQNTVHAHESSFGAERTTDQLIVSGDKACTVHAQALAVKEMNRAEKTLAAAISGTGTYTNPDNSLADEAKLAQFECSYGFVDTSQPDVKAIGGACAQSLQASQQDFGALDDIRSSVFVTKQYQLPVGATIDSKTSVITFPPLSQLTSSGSCSQGGTSSSSAPTPGCDTDTGKNAEQEYIAALGYCMYSKPSGLPLPDSRPMTGDKLHVHFLQSAYKKAANCSFNICAREVTYRTAVSKAAGAKSAALGLMYAAQARDCELMQSLHIIDYDTSMLCEANGMSPAARDDILAHKHASLLFAAAQRASGKTENQIQQETHDQENAALAFDQKDRDQGDELSARMRQCWDGVSVPPRPDITQSPVGTGGTP